MVTKETVQEKLTKILERDGCIKASAVVKEAKPKKSPIHDCFEWDDGKAADEHRLWQARHLIRVTVVPYEGEDNRLVHIRPVTVKGEGAEGEYRPINAVVKTIGEYERCLDELLKKIHAIQETVDQLTGAAGKHSGKNHVTALIKSLSIAENTVHLLRRAG